MKIELSWLIQTLWLTFVGIDGGFDNQEPEYDETYSIVILPDYATFPFPSVALPEKVFLLLLLLLFYFITSK